MGQSVLRTIKLTIAYEGTGYVGWQRQKNGRSIQAQLEQALEQIEGEPVSVMGAGRTDAGVHALGQVASVRLSHTIDMMAIARALNATLPANIRIMHAEVIDADFDARRRARAKTYRYRIRIGDVISPFEHRYAWHVPYALDCSAMRAAAALLRGQHDFSAFQATGSLVATTVRTIFRVDLDHRDLGARGESPTAFGERCIPAGGVAPRSQIPNLLPRRVLPSGRLARLDATLDFHPGLLGQAPFDEQQGRDGSLMTVDIEGDGFLRHMVRAMVGTLVEVGGGRRSVKSIERALDSRDRAHAGPTAPAHGLFLMRVEY